MHAGGCAHSLSCYVQSMCQLGHLPRFNKLQGFWPLAGGLDSRWCAIAAQVSVPHAQESSGDQPLRPEAGNDAR